MILIYHLYSQLTQSTLYDGVTELDNLMGHARCNSFKPFLLFWGATSQSIMLRPLGINVLSLCIQVNSLWSLSDFDLGMSLGTFMYSRICMDNRRLEVSHWLAKCLTHCSVLMVSYVTEMTLKPLIVFCF